MKTKKPTMSELKELARKFLASLGNTECEIFKHAFPADHEGKIARIFLRARGYISLATGPGIRALRQALET